jgi:hypothetical protein
VSPTGPREKREGEREEERERKRKRERERERETLLWEIRTETWDTETRKQRFIVLAQTYVQRLSPENKGVSPYIPLQAGNKGKKPRLNPYMVTCNSVDYFTLVLSAPLPLVLRDPLHVWIL